MHPLNVPENRKGALILLANRHANVYTPRPGQDSQLIRKERDKTMSDLQRQITARVDAFVNDITNLARRSALETLSAALEGKRSKPGPKPRVAQPVARRTAAPAKEPKAAQSSAGGRRSAGALARLVERLEKQIAAHPGQRIEQINAALGTKTKDVALPVKKLMAAGKIRSEGERRSTKYFPGGSGPKGKGKKK